MAKSKKAILVVGPPRSGTSAVANVVSELGVYFGDPAKFVDPEQQKHNPVFFELASLNRINDEIFKHFSKKWTDFDWIPDRSDFSETLCLRFEPIIVNFIGNEFGSSESIGLKDPRFCFTLPLWEKILARIGFKLTYVFVRRSSSSVFTSNKTVNGLSSFTNFRLVAQSNLLASRFVQSAPHISIFYEELLREPESSIREICRTANLPFDRIEKANSVLNRNLQHYNDSEKPPFGYFSRVIDSKEIDPQQYDNYREIYMSATHEKNATIEKLNLELAEKEQWMSNFRYSRGELKALDLLGRLVRTLVPRNSHRERFVRWVMTGVIKLYRGIYEKEYQNWLRTSGDILEEERFNLPRSIESLGKKPLISVLMPVYNPPIDHLDEAIRSVRNQIYPHWELCIADDASPHSQVRDLIERHAREEPRIRYVFRDNNGHMSACSNSALQLATGEFVALLDHDDILNPLALYYAAEEINNYPDAQVIYSDEDLLNESGKRINPYFKPDFDYDLLLSQNLISHLGVYRTDTIRAIGGFRIGFEGSQDHDLALRIIEKIEPRQVRHIKRVLYHWRVSSQSTSSGTDAKPYAFEAGLRAVKDHLDRNQIDALVEFHPGSTSFRVQYSPPQLSPSVDILIYASGFSAQLERCVNSILLNTAYENFKLSVLLNEKPENNPEEKNKSWQQDSRISIIQNQMEINRSKLLNEFVMNSAAEYVCLLDENIADFQADWLKQLMGNAVRQGTGAIGPLLLYPNDKILSGGIILGPNDMAVHFFAGQPKYSSHRRWAILQRGFSAISDLCLLVKRTHFLIVGGFNETLSTRYYTNIDFCLKLREEGLRNIVTPIVELYVHQDIVHDRKNVWKKYGPDRLDLEKDKKYIMDRWKAWLHYDPSFNPNLDIQKGRIILANRNRMEDN